MPVLTVHFGPKEQIPSFQGPFARMVGPNRADQKKETRAQTGPNQNALAFLQQKGDCSTQCDHRKDTKD
jgi:hypothetical protein